MSNSHHKPNIILKKSDREHTLINLELLGGGTEIVKKTKRLYDGEKFAYEEVEYIPVVLKIIEEIIDNGLDENSRTMGDFANDIKISIGDFEVEIEDNGRGVPTTEHEGNIQAIVAFTEAKTSGNFDHSTKSNSIGKFGVGSFLTNVCSKQFTVVTADGTQELTLKCLNNAESHTVDIKPSKKHFTKVTFTPDLALLKIDKIEDIYKRLIVTRLMHLSMLFSNIKFTIK